jgi:hypothetical protein
MARIELPLGLKGSPDLPRTLQGLRNCFNNQEGQIIGRDGITLRGQTTGFARGAFVFNGGLYAVTGTSLIKITNLLTGAHTVIGTIAGSANIAWDIDHNFAVIVVKDVGGAIYTLSTADALVDISGNANFVDCRDVAVIDGIWVYIPLDGDPAFFSDVGAPGTVQATSFFDAEELPDKNKGVINLRNTLYILGENSIETFKNVNASALMPFARVPGSRLDYGLLGGLQEYADTFIFIGRKKDQRAGIYAFAPGAATKLSNERMDKILESYNEDQLADAITNRVAWKGFDITTFRLSSDSFGFYKGEFFELDTLVNGESKPWIAGHIVQFNLNYYSFFEDDFGIFDRDANKDYGKPITRLIDTSLNDPEGRRLTCSKIEIGISQGLNPSVGSVALFMSKDNKSFPIPVYRNLGALGDYQDRLVWEPPGGLGNYLGFMGIRIYTTEDVIFSTDSFIAQLAQ